MVTLNPDGPHSPEYTRELGAALAETVRCLNYATRPDADGLRYPADAAGLLGCLRAAVSRLPQLLGQVGAWLDSLEGLSDGLGSDPYGQVQAALMRLYAAQELAGSLGDAVDDAQQAIAWLSMREDDDA